MLDPTTPPEGKPPRRIVAPDAPPTPLEQRGERVGLHFRRGRSLTSNSHLALEAAEFAIENGLDWPFHRAMFKAYFEDLADIGQVETVVEVAASVGLPTDELRAALTAGRYRDAVDDGIAWSRSIGVTAIPTFVFDERYGMVGAQEYDTFRLMMDKLGRAPKA